MARWFGVAYLVFVAVVAGWLLTAVSYELAPYCAGGAEWARATCFFLPLWRLFA